MTSTERAERLAALLGDDVIPLDDDDVAFDAPWQARVFGLALALHETNEAYDWSEFQGQLVDEIARTDPRDLQENVDAVYYERWLECFETLLVDEGIVSPDEIDRRKREFSDGERDASEFVGGNPTH